MSISKKTLNINGVDRMFIYDEEKDSLADVLRKIGLTGTKVGCKKGICGICSVILNGEVIRSCVKKMKAVEEYSTVVTIEGIGTPLNLHPLQQAFIYCGAVQCGFCSPGFIVSAKALLDENPDPTREEVRKWFKDHHNACRCTGYKQIVDAVMEAAAVLRGEKTMDDITYKVPENGKTYGTSYPRPAALAKVTGLCDYGDDIGMKMPDETLHCAVVLPGVNHANVLSIDTSEAEAMPGVVKVITHKDVPGNNRMMFPNPHPRCECDGFDHYMMVEDKVLRCGDVVALVVARSRDEARAAAKKVHVELEELKTYYTALDAVAKDAEQIHPEHPNVYFEISSQKGEDTRALMDQAAHVVETAVKSPHQPHLVLEPDTIQAYVSDDGTVNIHCKSLGIYGTKMFISAAIGVPQDKIRVIENPTGASFGYSAGSMMYGIMAVAAMVTKKPVSITLSYEEHQHITGKRESAFTNARLGCDENGKIVALDYESLYDSGAYSEFASGDPQGCTRFIGITYDVPNIRSLNKVSISNVSYTVPYRAAISVSCFTPFESLMDKMADEIGMDPFEFRYMNLMREGGTIPCGTTVTEYPMEEIYDRLRPYYLEMKKDAEENSTDEKKRAVGVSNACFTSDFGPNHAEVALELMPDGTIRHYNTAEDQGQGTDSHSVQHTVDALAPLGITPDQVRLVMNDTGTCPNTGNAAGSRLHFVTGRATWDAAQKLMNAMRKDDQTYRTYDEMVAEGIPTKYIGIHDTTTFLKGLDPNTCQGNPSPAYMWGAVAIEVEVDVKTCKVDILKVHIVTDCGKIGNPNNWLGQGYSGLMHGIGYGLREDYSDPAKHNNLINCGFCFIDMLPDDIGIDNIGTYRERSPFGAAGGSEVFEAGTHMAAVNAVNRALDIRCYELPVTPDKIKAELEAKAEGKTVQPDKYYLGTDDMWERIDYLVANPV